MTKRKQAERDPALAPLEEELAAAVPPPQDAPAEATPDEVEAGSLFREDLPADSGADAPTADAEAEAEAAPEALLAELEELRARSDEYLDGWQRARAEFANYKKRIEREQDEAQGRTTAAVLAKVLPVVDDLRLALRDRPDGDESRPWADGIELIYRKLTGLLEAEGVEPIPAEGEMFDPELHEAVTHEASEEHQEGQIIEVIQPGYRLGERILRPARVRVAR